MLRLRHWAIGALILVLSQPVYAQDNGTPQIITGSALLAGGVALEVLSYTAFRSKYSRCHIYAPGNYTCVYISHTGYTTLFAGIGVGLIGALVLNKGLTKRHNIMPTVDISPKGILIGAKTNW